MQLGTQELLKVEDLKSYFFTRSGVVKAVDGVSFSLGREETLSIVGESGSGKSVTMMSILGLIPSPPGKIMGGRALFHGQDLLRMNSQDLRKIRGNKISMIFQDPMTSLNPYLKVSTQLTEVLTEHRPTITHDQAYRKAIESLELVGIPDAAKRIEHYPHQFSGGMRQRVMIAMALIAEPELLIADEPTTALDVTIQAQILDILASLRRERGLSIIMITHDLGVVAGISDRVLVMYGGKAVEKGGVEEIFYSHRHPYTAGLLRSTPQLDDDLGAELLPIPGLPPDASKLPPGCSFAPRCSYVKPMCKLDQPVKEQVITPTHLAVCHHEGSLCK